ncbi:tRNA (guanosine(37)-N1)-methyltransferase TrmD, partial [Mycoplasmopsis synoviae]
DKKKIEFNVVDFRDFTKSKHRKVDDEIYGGGHGLLIQDETIDLALDSLENRGGYKILVTPQRKIFDQKMANKLAKYDQITLISGRYEGFDERVTYL